ncbi:MAG: hypothetical protein DRJ61_02015 [Acidobacteria bacterium]|nr:MAG: hypothetical protein DRJ65_19485 [Acidobacteriota bacterium]RLE35923.1 MAG: hypothetical protein DRJ61_02015 [Acidobacteriota bacterium]
MKISWMARSVGFNELLMVEQGGQFTTETQRTQRSTEGGTGDPECLSPAREDFVLSRQEGKRFPRAHSCLSFPFCLGTLRVQPGSDADRVESSAAWFAQAGTARVLKGCTSMGTPCVHGDGLA